MLSVIEIRSNVKKYIPDISGYYKWWANKETLFELLTKLGLPLKEYSDYLEYSDGLYCIYVGVATKRTLRSRIDWHINQKHTIGNVKNGVLSTLRQTISSVMASDMYAEDETNLFLNKLKLQVFPTSHVGNRELATQEISKIEKGLLSGQNYLYLLNIKENKHPHAINRLLKKIRKDAKFGVSAMHE